MPKYRKKEGVVVEAQQFQHGQPCHGVYGQHENAHHVKAALPEGCYDLYGPAVITAHQQVTKIESGDWIIAEPDGVHFYPCKPDIFEATYEPVDKPSEPSELMRVAQQLHDALEDVVDYLDGGRPSWETAAFALVELAKFKAYCWKTVGHGRLADPDQIKTNDQHVRTNS